MHLSLVSSRLLMVVASGGLAACVSDRQVAFTSRVNLAHATRIDGMVVNDVQSQALDAAVYRGFEAGLTQRLGSCGVRARVVHDAASLQDPASEAVQAVQSAAVMSIELASPPFVYTIGSGASGSSRVTVVFAFNVADMASRQTTWEARSTLEFHLLHNEADAKLGAWYATQVVSRLRDDGVLTGCPAAAAGWPEVDLPPAPPNPAAEGLWRPE